MTHAPETPSDKTFREMSIVLDRSLQFEHSCTKLARDYWRSCCNGIQMPSRTDLNPVAMRKFASHTGLIEVRPSDRDAADYFIRLAGSEWEQVFGRMTGRFLHEFLNEKIEARWRAVFDVVRDEAAPLRVLAPIAFEPKNWLTSEMFVAPLGQNGLVSMLFMTFVAWSKSKSATSD
jgi:hypothetical protein